MELIMHPVPLKNSYKNILRILTLINVTFVSWKTWTMTVMDVRLVAYGIKNMTVVKF
jgi:hypothetical protein